MAENQTTVVRIESGNHGGNTRVGVNGQFIEIPHEQDVPVHVSYAGALVDSNVEFKIVSGAVPRQLAPDAAGEGALPAASVAIPVNETETDESTIRPDRQDAETPDGAKEAEKNGGAGPIDSAATPAATTKAPPEMAQGSQGHVGMTDEQRAAEPSTTPEPGLDNQDAHKSEGEKAEDKETLASAADDEARKAAEAEKAEGDGELDGKPFVSADVLSGSIKAISENLDEFTPRQIRALIAAEEKAETPRTTLLEALNKKLPQG